MDAPGSAAALLDVVAGFGLLLLGSCTPVLGAGGGHSRGFFPRRRHGPRVAAGNACGGGHARGALARARGPLLLVVAELVRRQLSQAPGAPHGCLVRNRLSGKKGGSTRLCQAHDDTVVRSGCGLRGNPCKCGSMCGVRGGARGAVGRAVVYALCASLLIGQNSPYAHSTYAHNTPPLAWLIPVGTEQRRPRVCNTCRAADGGAAEGVARAHTPGKRGGEKKPSTGTFLIALVHHTCVRTPHRGASHTRRGAEN